MSDKKEEGDWVGFICALMLFFYLVAMIVGSTIRSGDSGYPLYENEACQKNYPVDYVIYTKLFCEIKS